MPPSRGSLRRALGKGYFPHQFSWLIDNPLRRLLLSPQRLAARLPLATDSRVLEVGPGSGYFSLELVRRVPRGRLALLDLQPEMIAKARRKLDQHGYHQVAYAAADAGAPLPFSDGTFDLAVLVTVLGEVPDPAASVTHLFHVLRPGGVLAIHEQLPDPDRIPFATLRPLVERPGFRLIRRWGPSWNYTALFERPP